MKIKSYEKVIDKDIIAVKSYLLKIGEVIGNRILMMLLTAVLI